MSIPIDSQHAMTDTTAMHTRTPLARWLAAQPGTLKDFAAQLGTSRQMVYHYANGTSRPSLAMFTRIQALTGLTADDLMATRRKRAKLTAPTP